MVCVGGCVQTFNSDQSCFPSRLPAKEALGGPNYLNCSMIMAALCSHRHRSALYLDRQAGAGEGRCSQGTPSQRGPWDLPSWGAAAVSFLFFSLSGGMKETTEWLFFH